MTQDTRKDRRVKIVSLNVRYKSATVDEFIENHALDVSRGGIYIKTGNPFPQGTLLKFEIRLASDQAVITGVGRVVWKRESAHGTGDRPAGMGVKFIKIDDPSKAVIDRLTNARPDAGRAFESEPEGPPHGASSPPAARPVTPAPPAAARAAVRPPGASSPAAPAMKATMVGLGSVTAPPKPPQAPAAPSTPPPPRPSPSTPPRPTPGVGMFPKGSSEPPKADQTVMKQAAELLEEALREAGGSMEDVGTNPLFTGGTPTPAVSQASSAEPASPHDVVVPPAPQLPSVVVPEGVSRSAPPAPTPSKPPGSPAAAARAMAAAMTPAPADSPKRISARVPPMVEAVDATPSPKKGGAGMWVLLFVVAGAVAVGFTFRDKILNAAGVGGGTGGASATASAAGESATAASSSLALPVPSASGPEADSVDASAMIVADSAAPADAADAASSNASPFVDAAVAARPAPAVPVPVPVARPRPRPAAAPTSDSTDTPAPTAAATAAPTATATTPPTASPTTPTSALPKPKITKPDDNPY